MDWTELMWYGIQIVCKGYDIDEAHVDLSSLITSAMQHKLVTDRGVMIRHMMKRFGWCTMVAPDGRIFMVEPINVEDERYDRDKSEPV